MWKGTLKSPMALITETGKFCNTSGVLIVGFRSVWLIRPDLFILLSFLFFFASCFFSEYVNLAYCWRCHHILFDLNQGYVLHFISFHSLLWPAEEFYSRCNTIRTRKSKERFRRPENNVWWLTLSNIFQIIVRVLLNVHHLGDGYLIYWFPELSQMNFIG